MHIVTTLFYYDLLVQIKTFIYLLDGKSVLFPMKRKDSIMLIEQKIYSIVHELSTYDQKWTLELNSDCLLYTSDAADE